MNYLSLLQKTIDYMEENMKCELYGSDLSDLCGFSLSHYYRLFQQATGKPFKEYIVRRKLLHSIYDISKGKKMIEVALDYGFETYSGFYKAFRKEFHMSPGAYVKTHNICKPIKLDLSDKETIMLSHKKIKEALEQWELSVTSIEDVYYDKNGIIKDNTWRINQIFTLKVGTNIRQLEQHIHLAHTLNKNGLESSIPILTKDKNDFYVENELYFFLYKTLEGTGIEADACYDKNYLSNGIEMGKMIGILHKSLASYDEDLILKDVNICTQIKDWALPEVDNILDLPENFYEELTDNLNKLYPFLERQLIHRNLNPSTIRTKNGVFSGFIDLELSEKNVRIFDPCYLSTAILSESFVLEDTDKLIKWTHIYQKIMTGYCSIIPLNKEEIQALPYVIFSIQLIFIAYLQGKNEHQVMLDTNIKMFHWLYAHKELLFMDQLILE